MSQTTIYVVILAMTLYGMNNLFEKYSFDCTTQLDSKPRFTFYF